MKLSAAYLNTQSGPPAYSDATEVAKAFAKAAPERMVWGSDWPHRGEKHMPDDAGLFDLLAEWAPNGAIREQILVDNPSRLYGFLSVRGLSLGSMGGAPGRSSRSCFGGCIAAAVRVCLRQRGKVRTCGPRPTVWHSHARFRGMA